MENLDIVTTNKNTKVGIKHPKFTADGENGQSHRRNRMKKKMQYLKNVATRSDLYRRFQGNNNDRGSGEFHATLKALSMGTA